jgi:hypothetical protein
MQNSYDHSDSGSGVEDTASGDGSDVGGFTSGMFGHTFFYSGHKPEVTRDLLEAAGFKIEVWEVDDPSSRGHMAVIAGKVM